MSLEVSTMREKETSMRDLEYENVKSDKIARILGIYTKLMNGGIVNKAEEARHYGVNERSTRRRTSALSIQSSMIGVQKATVWSSSTRHAFPTVRFWLSAKSCSTAGPLRPQRCSCCWTSLSNAVSRRQIRRSSWI